MRPFAACALLLCSACTSLSDPIGFHAGCYVKDSIVVESEMFVDRYCKGTAGFQTCTVGDTVEVYVRQIENPECAFRPPARASDPLP